MLPASTWSLVQYNGYPIFSIPFKNIICKIPQERIIGNTTTTLNYIYTKEKVVVEAVVHGSKVSIDNINANLKEEDKIEPV